MHDDNPNRLDHHRHHHRLLLYYLAAGAAGFAGSVLAVAFLSLTGLVLLVESCLAPSFFLANFISDLAGALAVAAGAAAGAAGVAVLAGSVAKARVVTKVAIRVAIVFISSFLLVLMKFMLDIFILNPTWSRSSFITIG